ncbi:N-acetylgalactosamine kinase [Sitophilus oryzae]|uniref:N-acetylgalactosamine kinase n=1 Tax=Sitophilus oryzae TaxID=7048 RepID=A0A6J2XKL2_SITOR|nr:N-acetylgalactosamine kinase [Sitophilus oryzae]
MSVEICEVPKSRKIDEIEKWFSEIYNKRPEFYIRVPGRVNLIGEHIDYCGYGVCPMAIEQDIFLAVSPENSQKKLFLHNLDPKFESYHCPLINDVQIELSGTAPKWYQYFLCGVKGILETLSDKEKDKIRGLEVIVSGTIPQGAGLSSSSALVSAAALATAHALKIKLTKEELANICAASERYIGTQGGGMDQAIAFLAQEGCAKLIEFEPLRSTEVRLPGGAVFVIAHSLSSLNKAATGDFNCRVVECRLATQIIAHRKGLDWRTIRRFGELQKALGITLDELTALTKEILHEEAYSKEEVIKELNTTSTELDEVSLTPNTQHLQSFKLYQRALHVLNEARRVEKFHKACKTSAGGEDSLVTLGNLMSQSHQSLKDLYECSHPQLDRIVELARGVTLGTRLTGAGWGGCTVSLVPPENVDKFVDLLIEEFYKPLGIKEGFQSLVFPTTPMEGARIYTPKN